MFVALIADDFGRGAAMHSGPSELRLRLGPFLAAKLYCVLPHRGPLIHDIEEELEEPHQPIKTKDIIYTIKLFFHCHALSTIRY